MRDDRERILPADIGVGLLVALAGLTLVEREAWINAYVLGQPQQTRGAWSTTVAAANRKLRDHFGTPEALRVAA